MSVMCGLGRNAVGAEKLNRRNRAHLTAALASARLELISWHLNQQVYLTMLCFHAFADRDFR